MGDPFIRPQGMLHGPMLREHIAAPFFEIDQIPADNENAQEEEDPLGEEPLESDEQEEAGAGASSEAILLLPHLPDEIWLPIVEYLDLGGWNAFIRVCQRFFNIGNDPQVVGHIFINEVRRRVAEDNYSLALVRSWQGIFRILLSHNLITPSVASELSPLLTETGHIRAQIPAALHILNQEIIRFDDFQGEPRSHIQRLWTQGTLLFRAESEPNGMFIREFAGLFNTMDEDLLSHITLQRLFALLDEFHHPAQAHVAALNALAILFAEGTLSDKDMQRTLTVMLHTITESDYPKTTRLSSASCIQRLLLGNVLSDLRKSCVVKALIRGITLPRHGSERRTELMNILDIETLLPILSPRLRGQLIEFLPILMPSVYLNNAAQESIIALLNANIMTEEELVRLANNLRPLVAHVDPTMRVRMVQILTEAILNENLSPLFRNACVRELRGLLNDSSLLVAEALLQSVLRLYEYHTDNVPMRILYEATLSLMSCDNMLIANMAIEFLQRFHEEQGEEGLLALGVEEDLPNTFFSG